ncbi:hypothetical protein ACFJIX_22745 [Roseateles sp. UC29_93]|uniref:hypothetical protein n=1 Tax=Roseateles sp. UC29_93 TaxID=3350177 RepID=UPI00366B4485
MLLDLNDASTIVEWWAVYPQRHGALLADWAQRRPEHRGAILEARRRINADPAKRGLLEQSRAELRRDGAAVAPPTHDELAAGEVGLAAAP